jgi:hypothetical protein
MYRVEHAVEGGPQVRPIRVDTLRIRQPRPPQPPHAPRPHVPRTRGGLTPQLREL